METIWQNPSLQFGLLFGAFLVFYSLALSAALNIRDNYRRHYQKADLQWTGPQSRFRRGRLRLLWPLLLALLSAWLVVRYWIGGGG